MEYIETIINSIINNFDFTYCLIVNILTFVIIQTIDDIRKIKTSIWQKRIVLLFVIVFTGIAYYDFGIESKILFNSAVLAPVSWSWIFKPICAKFNIDYKQFDKDN